MEHRTLFIATGRDSHNQNWREGFAQQPEPPDKDAGLIVKTVYKLRTDTGKRIYGLRSHWHHQGDIGIPPILAARVAGRGGLVVPGMSGL